MGTISIASRTLFARAALISALCIVSASGTKAGVLVGINPLPSPGPYSGDDNNGDMITVGTPSEPIPITPDPSGSAWIKQFTINRDGQGWSPGQTVTVMEWLTFPPTSTLRPTDWHETILPTTGPNSNFEWGGGSILIGTSTYPATLSGDGKSIWFDFPPIPPSAPPAKITKTLVWTDGVITPDQNGSPNNIYTVTVSEQPSVPEPSAFVLAVLSIVGLKMATRRPR